MSIGLYSIGASEAEKLKDKGYEIKVDEDEDGITKIMITNDNDEEVKFNNIYNKTEIQEMIVSNNLDKLQGIPDLNVYPGGSIPVIKDDGTIEKKYATTLRKLYNELTNNINNISQILVEYNSKILDKNGKIRLFTGYDNTIEGSKITDTSLIDTTTFSQLLNALTNNTDKVQAIFNNIYDVIEQSGFVLSDFLETDLITKGETFWSIDKQEIVKVDDKGEIISKDNYYVPKQYNVNKYENLMNVLFKLTEHLQDILVITPEFDLKVIDDYMEDESKDDGKEELSEESKKQIKKWKISEHHVQTLSDLITKLNDSNESLKDWITTLETIKETGIDPNKFGYQEITFNNLDIIEKDTENNTYSTVSKTITTLNTLIDKLSKNNKDAYDMILNNKPDFDLANFATKEIYPGGCLKQFQKTFDAGLKEIKDVKTYQNLFTNLNTNTDNLHTILNSFNTEINGIKNSEIEKTIKELDDEYCILMVLVNNQIQIVKAKIKIYEKTGDDVATGDEHVIDGVVNLKDKKATYHIVDKDDIKNANENKKTLTVNLDEEVNVFITTLEYGKKVLKGIYYAISYLVQAVASIPSYTQYYTIAVFESAFYLFTKYIDFTFYVVDKGGNAVYHVFKYFKGNESIDPPKVDQPIDSPIINPVLTPSPTPETTTAEIQTHWYSSWEKLLTAIKDSSTELWKNLKWAFSDNSQYKDENYFGFVFFGGMILIGLAPCIVDCLDKITGNVELLEGEVANVDGITFTTDDVLYKYIDELVNNYIKSIDSTNTECNLVPKDGFPDYYVKNDQVSEVPLTKTINTVEHTYNKLKINVPDEIKSKFTGIGKLSLFRIVLRKDVIFDVEGKYIKEFYITMNNRIYHCPIITYDEQYKYCSISYSNEEIETFSNEEVQTFSIGPGVSEEPDTDIFIAFDSCLNINPYELYKNGELSIMYLLRQNYLDAGNRTIKCNIIEADNALKLHKSNVHYFYKPDVISEDVVGGIEYYKMIFKIPSGYTIPKGLEFKFKEYCFGNEWILKWNGNDWEGENMQGQINSKIINKCNTRAEIMSPLGLLNARDVFGAWIMINNTDEFNNKILPSHSKGLIYSLWENSKKSFQFLMKDGTIKECADYYSFEVRSGYTYKVKTPNYSGYSYMPIECVIPDFEIAGISYKEINNVMDNKLKLIDKLYIDFILPEQTYGIRLTFRISGTYLDGHFIVLCITGEKDTIEKLPLFWSDKVSGSKDITLYLRKEYTDPIDEVNWDPTTNAFKYIIQQQFYEITPNPNAATTLYTDYNITSSKIITADNITTMRSDLNISNNVDVITFDVKEINAKIEILNSEMGEQKQLTKYLMEDVDQVKIMAGIALGFGGLNSLSIMGSGINFPADGVFRGIISRPRLPGEPVALELFDISSRSITTDIQPVINWCNQEYTELKNIELESKDSDEVVLTVNAAYELCNKFRDSLKPAFKLLGTRINEITSEVENIDVSEQLTTLETKIDNKLKEYVNKDELVRDDVIDIFPKVDNQNNILTFEFEGDTLYDGLLVFKIYAGAMISQMLRRLYIKIADVANNTLYFDEIFGYTQSASPPSAGSFTIERAMEQTYSNDVAFNYVFAKSVA